MSNDWTSLRRSTSIQKTCRRHREPVRNTTSGLVPPRWNSPQSSSRIFNSTNSSKNHLPHTGKRSKMPPLAMTHHENDWSNLTRLPVTPYLRCLLIDFDGVDCSVCGPLSIPRWRHRTGSSFLRHILMSGRAVEFHGGCTEPKVLFRTGSRCRLHVFWIDVNHLRLT